MGTRVIFNEITAGGTSQDITVTQETMPITIVAEGLAGAEKVAIQMKSNGEYVSLVDNSTTIQLDVNNVTRVFTAPCIFRLVADSTSGGLNVTVYDKLVN